MHVRVIDVLLIKFAAWATLMSFVCFGFSIDQLSTTTNVENEDNFSIPSELNESCESWEDYFDNKGDELQNLNFEVFYKEPLFLQIVFIFLLTNFSVLVMCDFNP